MSEPRSESQRPHFSIGEGMVAVALLAVGLAWPEALLVPAIGLIQVAALHRLGALRRARLSVLEAVVVVAIVSVLWALLTGGRHSNCGRLFAPAVPSYATGNSMAGGTVSGGGSAPVSRLPGQIKHLRDLEP
jgi:hypothetical protein